jgi:hypothetical protein
MPLLAEFSPEVVQSHALIVADILAGLSPSPDTLRELGSEVITIDKLAVMISRQVRTIQAARDTWQAAHECFSACAQLWDRLPDDRASSLSHRRLLARLLANAQERREFYTISESDRAL